MIPIFGAMLFNISDASWLAIVEYIALTFNYCTDATLDRVFFVKPCSDWLTLVD